MGSECHAYIPEYDTITVWHLRDLASGARKMIKAEKIKHINIPQFEGLTIETILAFARGYPKVMECLPEEPKELRKMPRQYIANIVYTVVGKPFYDWVDERVRARNKKVTTEANMGIEMDPEIAAIFKASTSVSGKYPLQNWHWLSSWRLRPLISLFLLIVSKGNSNNLMKIVAKRRRSKAQIQREKAEEEAKQAEVTTKLQQMDELKKQMALMQTQLDQAA